MLRVITDRQGDRYRLDLHGVLGGEWVPLLEQHWRSIMDDVPSAKVTLVLSNVDFIDPDGERLLQRMADDGVEFVVAGMHEPIRHRQLETRCTRGRRSTAMRCPARFVAAIALAAVSLVPMPGASSGGRRAARVAASARVVPD